MGRRDRGGRRFHWTQRDVYQRSISALAADAGGGGSIRKGRAVATADRCGARRLDRRERDDTAGRSRGPVQHGRGRGISYGRRSAVRARDRIAGTVRCRLVSLRTEARGLLPYFSLRLLRRNTSHRCQHSELEALIL